MRNYEKMLQAARTLRVEREKEHTLAQQKLEQKNQVSFSKNIIHFELRQLGNFCYFPAENFLIKEYHCSLIVVCPLRTALSTHAATIEGSESTGRRHNWSRYSRLSLNG